MGGRGAGWLLKESSDEVLSSSGGKFEGGGGGHGNVGREQAGEGVGDAFGRGGIGPDGVAPVVLACQAHLLRTMAGSWMRTRVPGGASVV